jgi:hypothetical protein
VTNSQQKELAQGIAAVLRGRDRLPLDAEPMAMPTKPSVDGLQPEEANRVLAKFEDQQKTYVDYLLRRPGTLSQAEQHFLGREIRRWAESGRPNE